MSSVVLSQHSSSSSIPSLSDISDEDILFKHTEPIIPSNYNKKIAPDFFQKSKSLDESNQSFVEVANRLARRLSDSVNCSPNISRLNKNEDTKPSNTQEEPHQESNDNVNRLMSEIQNLKRALEEESLKRLETEDKNKELELELNLRRKREVELSKILKKKETEWEEDLRHEQGRSSLRLTEIQVQLNDQIALTRQLQDSESKMQLQNDEIQSELNSLKLGISEYKAKVTELSEELTDTYNKIDQISKQKSLVAEQYEILSKKYAVIESKVNLTEATKIFDRKIDELRGMYQDYLEHNINQLKEALSERSKLELENSKMKQKIANIESDSKKQKMKLKDQIYSLRQQHLKELQDIRQKNDRTESESLLLSQNIKKLQIENERLSFVVQSNDFFGLSSSVQFHQLDESKQSKATTTAANLCTNCEKKLTKHFVAEDRPISEEPLYRSTVPMSPTPSSSPSSMSGTPSPVSPISQNVMPHLFSQESYMAVSSKAQNTIKKHNSPSSLNFIISQQSRMETPSLLSSFSNQKVSSVSSNQSKSSQSKTGSKTSFVMKNFPRFSLYTTPKTSEKKMYQDENAGSRKNYFTPTKFDAHT
eukprot:TRINITY_DN6751_c0_g1_i2.p1 TRINITY_DN6751_c0_g1~~TRINITY_DN6751_c0_g1_i2.p1  ORF type:complete len:593 (-),score=120.62 TRINITY_DN6751_c0_g1_i2:69-1847(-)